MKLYSAPVSMYGAKVEIAVIEKQIDLEVEFVPFSMKTIYEPKPDLTWQSNPKGEVPYLIDDDLTLFDSTLLFEFLEDLSPDIPLWPGDARQRAIARLWECKSDEVFFPQVTQFMPKRRANASEEDLQAASTAIRNFYGELDRTVADREFLVFDFSYADIACYTSQFFAGFLGEGPNAKEFPALAKWKHRMKQRDSVRTVLGKMALFLRTYNMHVPDLLD
ncbi:glutathione S-transferase N-terminal domain-containing protein [Sphingorhabdus sp. Alg231-15]|uniref:glutathione S-transferase N-terminal domain-containing protein n=1 Tax=Sphingorhabdus sp. Alg231-15 TaxID=1922222 RepID=UPI000D5563ED